ncbi:MAG: hypothetical protein P4M08_16170 [Oligoflexia bacterium]|nr:hypothetical protein [Oligoflexia bacterium]
MSSEAKKPTPASQQQQPHSEGHKKPEVQHVTKGKRVEPAPGGCHAWGCKRGEAHFNFCDEHYDHFKFGLIKKSGEPVPDYEKKFEHFQAWKSRQKSAHKVA